MATAVPYLRHQLCARAQARAERSTKPAQRQQLRLQTFGHTAWSALAASTVAAPLKRRREGRLLKTAGQAGEAVAMDHVILHGEADEEPSIAVMRYGVTDASLLPWTSAKLPSLLPEVSFSGTALAQEAAGCGPDQLAFFMKVLEAEEVDFVIAPAKDVALPLPEGLLAAAVLREDARDALVVPPQSAPVRSLSELPAGSRVCVTCARRRMQIAARFPSLLVEESQLRSQSILRRLYSLDYDAVVTAVAGLQRTGLHTYDQASVLDIDELMPAMCQGALTMLCRAKDEQVVSLLAAFDDSAARICVVAERDLLKQLGRLPDGATVGGLAELRPDNQLSLKCVLALPCVDSPSPRITEAHNEGLAEDAEALVRSIVDELRQGDADLVSALSEERPAGAPIRARIVQEEEEDEDLEDADAQGPDASEEALPGRDAQERLPASEFDLTGGTAYTGRVCAILPDRRGVLVDINCEVPAFWYPELVSAGDSSSSSSSASSQSTSSTKQKRQEDEQVEGLPLLGSEMEVYCCAKYGWLLRALRQKPPRLPVRVPVAPLRLDELRPGLGPWRAIVISATDDGTLVDFNCEIPGLLQADQPHLRGEELRVYCYRVDVSAQMCVVGTVKETRAEPPARRKLEDLISMDTSVGIRGSVLRVAESGVFVDVNCEVQGYLSPMDIDMMQSASFCKGYEVTVYIKQVNLLRRRVALSMFPLRKPVKVIGGEGSKSIGDTNV